MFKYNLNANYQLNGGGYLQILSGKDLYKQAIVVSDRDTFPARFPNIFVDYPLGQMKVGDKLWTNHLYFFNEARYFLKHFRFQRKGLSDATQG